MDAGLQQKLNGATDLDAAVATAKQVGFDVSKADFLKAQASQILEMSDEELEGVSGGVQGGLMSMNVWMLGQESTTSWDPRCEFSV